MNICVISGSRDWAAVEPIHAAQLGADMLLVGDCPTGADAIASAYAKANDIMLVVLVADWTAYGNKAGPIRNQAIADRAAQMRDDGIPVSCHAFPLASSRGTWDCKTRLEAHGFHVTVHEV